MCGRPALPALSCRLVTPTDQVALGRFRCSSGLPWEDEVEHHVAHVHRENARSLRMFERMGFEAVEIEARSLEYVTVGARV